MQLWNIVKKCDHERYADLLNERWMIFKPFHFNSSISFEAQRTKADYWKTVRKSGSSLSRDVLLLRSVLFVLFLLLDIWKMGDLIAAYRVSVSCAIRRHLLCLTFGTFISIIRIYIVIPLDAIQQKFYLFTLKKYM